MSVRLLTHRLFNHGRYFIQNYCKRQIHTNILEGKRNIGSATVAVNTKANNLRQNGTKLSQGIRNNSFVRFGRRLFVDNILNRVTTSYSCDLRTEATKKFFYGDSVPFFALVGVSLASGTGILTKEDELEGVCWEIREAVSRLQDQWYSADSMSSTSNIGLDNLNIGPPIAKGCAAVVYAAAIKPESNPDAEITSSPIVNRSHNVSIVDGSNIRNEMMSPIQNTSRFLHNFGGSVDNLYFNRNERSRLDSISETSNDQSSPVAKSGKNVRFNTMMNVLHSHNAVISSSSSSDDGGSTVATSSSDTVLNDEQNMGSSEDVYPLALKMMFNYDIQSNAMTILRAMYKETIPARNKQIDTDGDNWQKLLMDQTINLPAHPNIVHILNVFCDQIPNLMGSSVMYPMALPPRINPQGYGRNMSLFLLMKRYNSTLYDYLHQHDNITMRSRLLLFAQLLEAVAHMYRYGIAHRDLKSDNILIDTNDNDLFPILVVSDFGCCLADRINGLTLPYTSNDMDKGGNTALMAPEIITQTPGRFSLLDYTKSDLWACGAISYEIFGEQNPFYSSSSSATSENVVVAPTIRSDTYLDEDLPKIHRNNHDVPIIVGKLMENILQRNPNKRLSPDIAANVMQLFLWAPSSWLKNGCKISSTEMLQWLLSLTTKVLCDARIDTTADTSSASKRDAFGYQMGRRTYTEYLLISSFLARAQLQRIRYALDWIQSIV